MKVLPKKCLFNDATKRQDNARDAERRFDGVIWILTMNMLHRKTAVKKMGSG